MVAAAELTYNTNASATQMAQEIFGDGVTIVSASYSGDNRSSAIFSDGDTIAPGATPADSGVILSTGRARDYTNSSGQANQDSNTSTNTQGGNNVDLFDDIDNGASTYDASYITVSFVPDDSTMSMQFIFASEEYPEYTNSVFQDAVAVEVNGQLVPLSFGNGDTDPGNINSGTNENLFLSNSNSDYNTEMDGLTVTMTLTINVDPGVVNTIRIGITDVSDSSYDSNLLIAAGSLQTALIANDNSATLGVNGTRTVDVLDNDSASSTLTITHINGQAVVAGSTVLLPTGQSVQLNADGTITMSGDGDLENFNFTYTVTDGTNSDTGIVNVTSLPCFVEGTMIRTPDGERLVEELKIGDLVCTRDDGPQPLRWVGQRRVHAPADLAPICIGKGAMGNTRDLWVSPQHRVLIDTHEAELLFGEAEVLVAAKDLVNDTKIRRTPAGPVCYVHFMFDAHQLVYSEGMLTESFLPGPQTTSVWEQPIVDEICRIFPELDPQSGAGYSAAARPTLKSYEARVLSSCVIAA